MFIVSVFAAAHLSGCSLLRPKYSKVYKTKDFFLYDAGFIDSTGLVKYNGVYKIEDSSIGFTRFYPDGKVVQGGCYGDIKSIAPNECFDNGTKISLNGYYQVRHDTIILEMTDNALIGEGVRIYIWRINSDTITSVYSFNRRMLKSRDLNDIPHGREKGVESYHQKRVFTPIDLTDRIKKDW